MSFVIADPELVVAAAGQLAGIRSSIGAAAPALHRDRGDEHSGADHRSTLWNTSWRYRSCPVELRADTARERDRVVET